MDIDHDVKSLKFTFSSNSAFIDINGTICGSVRIEHFTDASGSTIQRTTWNEGETVRQKSTTLELAVLKSMKRIIAKCASIRQLHVKLDPATRDDFSENHESFTSGLSQILKNRKQLLEVKQFKFSCNEVHDWILRGLLSNCKSDALESVVLCATKTPKNLNIDLGRTSRTAQWKSLKKLHSDFPITGGWWDHIPVVSFKVTEMCSEEFSWFLGVVNTEFSKCQRLTLHAEHLELHHLDVEAILGVESGAPIESLVFPMKQGYAHCTYNNLMFDIRRSYD